MSDVAQGAQEIRQRSCAILGAAGFLGAALCHTLTDLGWRVIRIHTDTADQRAADLLALGSFGWGGDIPSLAQRIQSARPDVVVNLSARYVTDHTADDMDELVDANIRRPAHVLEAMRIAGVRSYVSAGTFWEEMSDADPAPVNLYAATRCASKALLHYYADAYGWSAVHLRVSDLYGPRDSRGRLFSLLREAVRTRRTLAMSPGEQLVDLVYVADAAAAFAKAAQRCADFTFLGLEEYGMPTGQPRSLRDVVDLYASVIGAKVPATFGARPYRSREVMDPRFIDPVPGWTPSFGLADGIRAMEMAPGGLLTT